jgi:hypothetical protein
VLAAAPLGTWVEVARVTLNRRAPEADDLRFNFWVTGGGIEPVGALMSLRDPTYRTSHAATDGSRYSRMRRRSCGCRRRRSRQHVLARTRSCALRPGLRQARSSKEHPFPAGALGH